MPPKTDKYNEFAIAVAAMAFIFLALSGVIVFVLFFYQRKRLRHKQQLLTMQNTFEQEILKTQLETQEYSFHQISEELHDNVGQLLSTTKLLLGITERSLHNPPDSLKTASETLGKAIQDIRSLSKSLSNEWLHQFNIIENLQVEFDRLKAAKQVNAKFNANCQTLPLEPKQQVMLFRVMQEALQNSIKHANATEISVQVRLADSEIYLCLADNGTGFNWSASTKKGLGIINMQHRIKLLGGDINWISSGDNGTQVDIVLPINNIAA